MGLLLGIVFIVLLVLLIKYRKAKNKWIFFISTPIVLAVIIWYVLPFHIELTEYLDVSTASVSVDSTHSKEVEITDSFVKSEILDILSSATYQRNEFLGTYFARLPYTDSNTDSYTYIKVIISDLNTGEVYRYYLIDESPFKSSVILTSKNRWYSIQNSSDIIADINELLDE